MLTLRGHKRRRCLSLNNLCLLHPSQRADLGLKEAILTGGELCWAEGEEGVSYLSLSNSESTQHKRLNPLTRRSGSAGCSCLGLLGSAFQLNNWAFRMFRHLPDVSRKAHLWTMCAQNKWSTINKQVSFVLKLLFSSWDATKASKGRKTTAHLIVAVFKHLQHVIYVVSSQKQPWYRDNPLIVLS